MNPIDQIHDPLVATGWQLRDRALTFGKLPCLMGIVNVTPDSFSDGGLFLDPSAAVDHALQLVEQGADLLDIGGESTRPYSSSVDADEEARRVVKVIERLSRQVSVPISIDTSKASVARQALDAGAQIINDVTALTGDKAMVKTAVETGAGVCAMHMQGTPQTMQDRPTYDDVVTDILNYLGQRQRDLVEAGIAQGRICLDPGIGFGKTHEHNLELLRRVAVFHQLGSPVLVGHSRKGFIGKVTGDGTQAKTPGTTAVTLHLARARVQVIRVHDVLAMKQALKMAEKLGESRVDSRESRVGGT